MPKFKVKLSRTDTRVVVLDLEIEADSQNEAERLAIQEGYAGTHDKALSACPPTLEMDAVYQVEENYDQGNQSAAQRPR